MAFRAAVLATLLGAMPLLAGCTIPTPAPATGSQAPSEHPVDASTYHITLDWVIQSLQPGSNFTFGMQVHGQVSTHSDHIGAHIGPASIPNGQASSTTYPTKCVHVGGRVPNAFQVTCTAPSTPGTYYIRGHVMEERDSQPINWWSAEESFQTR